MRDSASRARSASISTASRGASPPFPVAEGRFGQIAGVAGGKVVWTTLPIPGAHGRGGHKETPGRLESFDFATLRSGAAARQGRQLRRSPPTTRRWSCAKASGLRAIRADRTAGRAKDAPTPVGRAVAQERLDRSWTASALSVDPRREWRQMLREVWRLQRDQFWVPNMSGIDWDAIYRRYEPLLDARRDARRAVRPDLGDAGRARHVARVRDGRRSPPAAADRARSPRRGAAARATTARLRDRAHRRRRPVGCGADSPLNAVGVRGEGRRAHRRRQRPAGVARAAAAGAARASGGRRRSSSRSPRQDGTRRRRARCSSTTLADEVPARYREWVERNRAWVHAQSDGRVGYFHLPDMMSAGLRRIPSLLQRRMRPRRADRRRPLQPRRPRVAAAAREGRAQAHRLRRARAGGSPTPYPDESPRGPVVALTNEHAGSDGDIFSHCFKLMEHRHAGRHAHVGRRRSASGRGTRSSTAARPRSRSSRSGSADVGWGVENYGTDPEIEVDNAPQDAAAKHDRQLREGAGDARCSSRKARVRSNCQSSGRARTSRARAAAAAQELTTLTRRRRMIASFRLRITRGDDRRRPGKVDLLAAIAETGSITAAAKRARHVATAARGCWSTP